MRRLAPLCLLLLSAPFCGFAEEPASFPPFDAPATLEANAILSPEFLNNPLFSVRHEVPTREGFNDFTIDSEVGVFTATGNVEFIQRATEVHAIEKLREISRGESYKKALENAAKSPLQLTEKVFEHPVDTVSQTSKGLWKKLNGIGQSIKEAGQGRTKSIYEDSSIENAIGFSAAKREIAFGLGVDPYSTNPLLQEELKKVAWAAFGGKMTFAGALLPISGPAGTVIKSVNAGGNSLASLRDLSPSDLRLRNLKLLLGMGFDRAQSNAFLNNPYLSPTHQTLIIDAMSHMPRVKGRRLILLRATAANTELQAIRCQRIAQLLAQINEKTPIKKLVSYHGLPVGLTSGGKLAVALEWDYAQWTPTSRDFLLDLNTGKIDGETFSSLDIHLTGTASPAVKAVLASCEIPLTEKALPGPLNH